MRPVCRHCRDRIAQPGKRGLCHVCFPDKSIRDKYSVDPKCGHSGDYHEPTMEELDALIAQQLPTMPKQLGKAVGKRLSKAERNAVSRRSRK